MVTWHGLEGGAIEIKGSSETILGVSQLCVWLALLILICLQTNAYCAQREEASGRYVPALSAPL